MAQNSTNTKHYSMLLNIGILRFGILLTIHLIQDYNVNITLQATWGG